MHIIQVVPELNQGGVERGVVELSRELVKRGHKSTVISAGGKLAAQIEKDGGNHITLDVCSKNPLTFPFRVSALHRILHEFQVFGSKVPAFGSPILHARSRVPAWLCWFANKKLRIPLITTIHGFNSVSKYSEIMTKGDLVVYGSSEIKSYVLKNYEVDASCLRYVPRGIDTEYFDPAEVDPSFIGSFRKNHDLRGKYIITIVGRITEWKGHDTFIRAIAAVHKKHPEVVGVIAGGVWHDKQDYLRELKALVKGLDAEEAFRFVGSQALVREIYDLSDLVISAASTKPETFGRTAAEALAMNTPVIASAHGGSLDILIDGENGLLFEPGNEKDLAEKIEQAMNVKFSNMREYIQQNFSLDQMTESELNVCEELMG
jgi:glycosyltransferase involved in cell wall biosynthesis